MRFKEEIQFPEIKEPKTPLKAVSLFSDGKGLKIKDSDGVIKSFVYREDLEKNTKKFGSDFLTSETGEIELSDKIKKELLLLLEEEIKNSLEYKILLNDKEIESSYYLNETIVGEFYLYFKTIYPEFIKSVSLSIGNLSFSFSKLEEENKLRVNLSKLYIYKEIPVLLEVELESGNKFKMESEIKTKKKIFYGKSEIIENIDLGKFSVTSSEEKSFIVEESSNCFLYIGIREGDSVKLRNKNSGFLIPLKREGIKTTINNQNYIFYRSALLMNSEGEIEYEIL